MKNNRVWLSTPITINLICNLITSDNLVDVSDFRPQNTSKSIRNFEKQGSWIVFDYLFETYSFKIFVYRKRIIVQSAINSEVPQNPERQLQPLDRIVKSALSVQDIKRRAAFAIAREIYREINFDIKSCLFVICDSLRRQKTDFHESSWIDDGLTTFFTRVYDSYSNRFGYFRVSRHLSISFNISDQLNQDFINIMYENFLYKDDISNDDVFKVFDSLSKYVLPTEVNLYIQKIFYFLAVFGVSSGVLISLINDLSNVLSSPNFSMLIFLVKYVVMIALLIMTWMILSMFIKQKFRF